VTEPNNVKTRYGYDVGNRLVKVCQGATGAGTATCGQQRLFNYDLRGFLLSEQHPEKGASGNGTVSYFNYDALGHAARRVDGPNDLTFTFDKAERMTQARETGGLQRVVKSFTYATQNVSDMSGTDWRKGKITSASRFNYVGAPFNATAEVRDTFVYRAAEGRVSEMSRQLVFNAVDEEKFTTTYAYDGLGLVSTLGYPDCVAGDCTALDTPRTVTFNYNYGRLVSVPGVTGAAGGVSQISYYSNGLVNQVPHVNGVLFTQQNDPNGMARPGGMSSVKGATTLWTVGTYGYDGTGNVKATGAQTYVYDNRGRIVQGNLPGNVQGYAYDNYGNLQSITTDMSVQNTPTSSSTNRLTAGTYDAAGNLTAWSGNTYEYDRLNQLVRYHSGAEDWVYLYGPDDERFWSYRAAGAGAGSLWTLRDLFGRVLRQYQADLGWGSYEDFVYRDGLLLAGLLSSGQQRHFDVDHLGSVRLITDAAGNQSAFHRYYPFGKEHTALQEGDRMKFTGHERDLANTAGDGDDLDYMHARHYSPVTGRFTSVDPEKIMRPQEPQSWNRYSYAWGSPLKLVDPDGRDVTVAPLLNDAVSKGAKASQTFSTLYDRLRFDGNIHWNIKPMQFSKPNARAYSTISITRVGGKVQVKITSYIPLRQSWQRTAELIGHEGSHGAETLDTGMLLKQRYLNGDTGVHPNPLAGSDAYESDYALATEATIHSEIIISQQASASGWMILDSLSSDVFGDGWALAEFGGTLYIDGINLSGVFTY
jgi:RHS repeat-associated protein